MNLQIILTTYFTKTLSGSVEKQITTTNPILLPHSSIDIDGPRKLKRLYYESLRTSSKKIDNKMFSLFLNDFISYMNHDETIEKASYKHNIEVDLSEIPLSESYSNSEIKEILEYFRKPTMIKILKEYTDKVKETTKKLPFSKTKKYLTGSDEEFIGSKNIIVALLENINDRLETTCTSPTQTSLMLLSDSSSEKHRFVLPNYENKEVAPFTTKNTQKISVDNYSEEYNLKSLGVVNNVGMFEDTVEETEVIENLVVNPENPKTGLLENAISDQEKSEKHDNYSGENLSKTLKKTEYKTKENIDQKDKNHEQQTNKRVNLIDFTFENINKKEVYKAEQKHAKTGNIKVDNKQVNNPGQKIGNNENSQEEHFLNTDKEDWNTKNENKHFVNYVNTDIKNYSSRKLNLDRIARKPINISKTVNNHVYPNKVDEMAVNTNRYKVNYPYSHKTTRSLDRYPYNYVELTQISENIINSSQNNESDRFFSENGFLIKTDYELEKLSSFYFERMFSTIDEHKKNKCGKAETLPVSIHTWGIYYMSYEINNDDVDPIIEKKLKTLREQKKEILESDLHYTNLIISLRIKLIQEFDKTMGERVEYIVTMKLTLLFYKQ